MTIVLSHSRDTVPAHAAAEYMEKSGKATIHRSMVVEAICNSQGSTAAEIGEKTGLGHIEAQRRISDLKNKGLIEYREPRKCNELDFCVVDGQSEREKWPAEIASTLNASSGSKLGLEDQHVNSDYPLFVPSIVHPIHDKATHHKGGGSTRNGDGAGNGLGIGSEDALSYTLTSGDRHAIALQGNMIGRKDSAGPQGSGINHELSFTLNTTDRHAVSCIHGTQDPISSINLAHALGRNSGQENAICYDTTQITSPENGANPKLGSPCHSLNSMHMFLCLFQMFED